MSSNNACSARAASDSSGAPRRRPRRRTDMTMRVYLDHNATAPLRARGAGGDAGRARRAAATRRRCTPTGRAARARIDRGAREQRREARRRAAATVIFTSGGTEANTLALRGALARRAGGGERITRLFVSAIEHDCVRATAAALRRDHPGFEGEHDPGHERRRRSISPSSGCMLMRGQGTRARLGHGGEQRDRRHPACRRGQTASSPTAAKARCSMSMPCRPRGKMPYLISTRTT